jgi:choline dehydrogenase-like flavoprotein
MPAALPFVYQSRRVQWGYVSGPEPELNGREIDEKSGRVLGGTSSINAMIFNRGNPLDYDGWAADRLVGWDYAHCLPYFKRMETFVDGGNEWPGGFRRQPGRGLTEHLLTGDYRTVDLTRLGYARIDTGQPYAELGVR